MTQEHAFQTIFHRTGILAFLPLVFILGGCGSSEKLVEEEPQSQPPTYDLRMQLQRQIDSLSAENERLQDQVTSLTAENHSLTTKNAGLEARLNDVVAAADNEPAIGGSGEEAAPALPAAYNKALALFRQRQYREASVQFIDLLSTNLRSSVASNSKYWIGECQLALKNYDAAVQYFEAAVQYKDAQKAPDARYMIGVTYAAAGNAEAAKEAFDNVIRLYPKSEWARKAKEKLRTIK